MSVLKPMYRNDSRTVTTTIPAVDEDGNQVLQSSGVLGWQFRFTAKLDPEDGDSLAVIRKAPNDYSVPQYGDTVNPAIIVTTIQPADTAALPAHQVTLYWDVQGTDPNGHVYTIDAGQLNVNPDISVTAP